MNLVMATDGLLGIKVRPALLLLYQHTHTLLTYTYCSMLECMDMGKHAKERRPNWHKPA